MSLMKKIILYPFVLGKLCVESLYAQNQCNACEKLKNNVVQITAVFKDGKEENGFGTVISEVGTKLYIVTAKHVIYTLDDKGFISIDNKTTSVSIKFFSDQGKDYPATLLNLPNSALDISLLEVEKPKSYTWEKDFYSKAIQKGTKVWFIGRAGKWYIPTGSFVGSINDVSPDDEILIDINSIQPGTSGAPLISPDGLVGFIFEDAANGAKAYPIDKVIKLITKTWNYKWQMNLNLAVTQPEVSEKEDKAWTEIINEKKEKNKVSKLEDYVAKEQGAHVEEAKKMYEGMLWADIGNRRYQEKYVQHFPEGKYIKQLEDKVYRNVTPGFPLTYQFYLGLFPKGRYVDEVNKLSASKKTDEESTLWADAKNGSDMAIERYLEKFPQGQYLAQIEEISWQNALKGESKIAFKETGFEEYLKHFPKGKYSRTALEKIRKYK